jgi:hypothetical protein
MSDPRKNAIIIIALALIVLIAGSGIALGYQSRAAATEPTGKPMRRGSKACACLAPVRGPTTTTTTAGSKIGLAESNRMQALSRLFQGARETILRRKWVALGASIFLVLAVAGAITGTLLHQRQQQAQLESQKEGKAITLQEPEDAPERGTEPAPAEPPPPQKELPPGAIAAIVIGTVVLAAIISCIAYYYYFYIYCRNKYKTLYCLLAKENEDFSTS